MLQVIIVYVILTKRAAFLFQKTIIGKNGIGKRRATLINIIINIHSHRPHLLSTIFFDNETLEIHKSAIDPTIFIGGFGRCCDDGC